MTSFHLKPLGLSTAFDPSRRVYLGYAKTLDDWPDVLDVGSAFALLAVMDATDIADAAIEQFARKLFAQGAVYVHTWGPDCGRVHHMFDVAEGVGAEPGPFTTDSYPGDDIDEALWGALWSVDADDPDFFDKCRAVVVSVIGDLEQASAIEEKLAEPDEFDRRFVERDAEGPSPSRD